VSATLDNVSVFEHDDLIGMHDGAQALGDDQGSASLHQRFERGANLILCATVNAGRSVVQNEDAWVYEYSASDGNSLPLPTRQGDAAFAYKGVVALRKFRDEVMSTCRTCCLFNLLAPKAMFS